VTGEFDKVFLLLVEVLLIDDQGIAMLFNLNDVKVPGVSTKVIVSLLYDVGHPRENLLQVSVLEVLAVLLVCRPIARLARLAVGIRLARAASAVGEVTTDDARWLNFWRHLSDCREMLQRVSQKVSVVDQRSLAGECRGGGSSSLGGAGQYLIRTNSKTR
jgi:hypothetical protein